MLHERILASHMRLPKIEKKKLCPLVRVHARQRQTTDGETDGTTMTIVYHVTLGEKVTVIVSS